MKSIIVADSRRHASIMREWLKLDADDWRPVAYGDKLSGRFLDAIIVRPLGGTELVHVTWVLDILRPHVRGNIATATCNWIDESAPEPSDGPGLAQLDWHSY